MLLGDDIMPHTKSLTHLGVSRNLKSSNADVVSSRIATAAKASYALMPSDLHGENGISPHASRRLVLAYILPRLIYGLEALVINKSELGNLDRAYTRLLKSLLALRTPPMKLSTFSSVSCQLKQNYTPECCLYSGASHG